MLSPSGEGRGGQHLRPNLDLGFGVRGVCVMTGCEVLGLSKSLWAWPTLQSFMTCGARNLPGLWWQEKQAVLTLSREETQASLVESTLENVLVSTSVSQGPSEGRW